MTRVDLDRGLVVNKGCFIVSGSLMNTSPAKVAVRVFGAKADDSVEIHKGPVQIAFVPVRIPAIVEELAAFRTEADGLIIVRKSSVQVAFIPVCNPTIVEGSGVFGVEADGFAVIRKGLVQIALVPVRNSAIVEGFGAIAVGLFAPLSTAVQPAILRSASA